jgi:hypothetical protein
MNYYNRKKTSLNELIASGKLEQALELVRLNNEMEQNKIISNVNQVTTGLPTESRSTPTGLNLTTSDAVLNAKSNLKVDFSYKPKKSDKPKISGGNIRLII